MTIKKTKEARKIITQNDIIPGKLNQIPTFLIFVDFTYDKDTVKPPPPLSDAEIKAMKDQIFDDDNAKTKMNGYFKEISYGWLKLVRTKPEHVHVTLNGDPIQYSWGYIPGDTNPRLTQRFVIDTVWLALADPALSEFSFQDKFLLILPNLTEAQHIGRGAMCLVPGVVDFPYSNPPDMQEFLVGPAVVIRPPVRIPPVRKPFFISQSTDLDLNQYTWSDYIALREQAFNKGDDQFVRGVCIFFRDAALSCAVHDVLHGLKRIAKGIPPDSRGRAIVCLYNLYIQGDWMGGIEGAFPSPYIGWWDNTGDHLHPNTPREFFYGPPYGVSAFTKLKLGVIDEAKRVAIAEKTGDYRLGTLSLKTLDGIPDKTMLAVKVPLTYAQGDKLKANPVEYLLVEYRYSDANSIFIVPPGVDNLSDVYQYDLAGSSSTGPCPTCFNPPNNLVPGRGLLIYHVNEEMSQFPLAPSPHIKVPSADSQFVTAFIIYLYTPAMISTSGEMAWKKRTPDKLRDAAFGVKVPFTYKHTTGEIIQIILTSMAADGGQVKITRKPARSSRLKK